MMSRIKLGFGPQYVSFVGPILVTSFDFRQALVDVQRDTNIHRHVN